jgi:hypothetical protein
MAKRLLHSYQFIPSEDKIILKENIDRKRLLLITNTANNDIIFNFADNTLGLSSYSYNSTTDETTIILQKDCASMSSTDIVQIFYEGDSVPFQPDDTFVDPVSKFRVSTPQNLIDTDFEYGPQSSKWETIQLINNVPSFYSSTSDTSIPFISQVNTINGSDIIEVVCGFDHGLLVGTPITVNGLSSVSAEGSYLVQSIPTSTTFTYKARANQAAAEDVSGVYTSVIPGQFYQGSQILVDEAEGITADFFNIPVTVNEVTDLTMEASVPSSFVVGATVNSGTSTAVITKVSGTVLSVIDRVGPVFNDAEVLTTTSTNDTITIAAGGVATGLNKFFLSGIQQQSLDLSKRAIYLFDLSDASTNGHPFKLSETDNGTHNSGVEYNTYVYENGTAGTADAYVRIYVTNTTPNLHYYCDNHTGMGGSIPTVEASTSRIFLKTQSEHGFADNTNFYFVNTVAPKILQVNDPTVTAPDGRPFVDIVNQTLVANANDPDEYIPFNYESTYTERFGETDVDYSTDRITVAAHRYHNSAAVLYYPSPGNTPIGGLNRMLVYYTKVIDANTIELHQSQRLNNKVNLSNSGSWGAGKHCLGLCYNVYQEQKSFGGYTTYWYTYYHHFGGTYSGYDFSTNSGDNNTSYGLGKQQWTHLVGFSNNRPGYSGHDYFILNRYNQYFSGSPAYYGPKTYGYHIQTLPLGTGTQFQGSYDFVTNKDHDGETTNLSNGYIWGTSSYSKSWGSYFGTMYVSGVNSSRAALYGSDFTYWAYDGYFFGYYFNSGGVNRYFNSVNSDGNTNMYYILLKKNTSTNDSFYCANHNFSTNTLVDIKTTGTGISYWTSATGSSNLGNNAQVYVEKIDANRFRIKSSTGASPYRIRGVDGTASIAFEAITINPTKNSIYIADNQFSNNEIVTYSVDGSTVITGITDQTAYYVKAINGNRFQLGTTVNFSTEIDFTGTGTGIQIFENTTADFGAVDGSYTTTTVIGDKELEVAIPFKLSPAQKAFDGTSNVNTGSDYITINNHYFTTGQRVFYDARGNTAIGGLTDNKDYFIIMLDDEIIQLAETKANASAGVAVTLTSQQTGTHAFVSANLSGLVGGNGTVDITNGSRTVIGTGTGFKRFFKVGDRFQIVDDTTTPGTIITKTITALKDDEELLVDTAYTVDRSGEKYLIPSYIYVRPDGYYLHRPFDGGMEIATSKSPDGLICRQTRKYFRYQSGKGIQTSFAINFIPQILIKNLSYVPEGTQVTATATGTTGATVITVTDATGIIADMHVSGNGIAPNATVSEVNGLDITLTLSCDGTLTGVSNVVFSPARYAHVSTPKPHNIVTKTSIIIANSDDTNYNGSYPITQIVDDYTLKVLLSTEPSVSTSGGFPSFSVIGWNNSFVRAGMFDFQNGFYFEHDGSTLNCVRRSSVQQLQGEVNVTKNSGVITGVDTSFTAQIVPGEMVVIRGMSYKVVKINSNSSMSVQPAYRGVSAEQVILTKTVDVKVPQAEWNRDTCDGTGKSGYVVNLQKIQMCYIDYSWYGAGKIRFGFKDQHGHVKYVHEFIHNNKLQESYFRSGNLPARYEVENIGAPTYVPSLFHWGTSVIMDGMFQDDEAYLFTASGDIFKYTNDTVQTSTTTGGPEILSVRRDWTTSYYYIRMPFPSADATQLTNGTLLYNTSAGNNFFVDGRAIDTRSRTAGSTYFVYVQYKEGTQEIFPRNYLGQVVTNLGGSGYTYSGYSSSDRAYTYAINGTTFDNGTSFNVGALAGGENLIPTNIPLISIRLAPSVDSSLTGDLGAREIINRMQLNLQSMGILTSHETEITLVLNSLLNSDAYENAALPSLCQLLKHTPNDSLAGGQEILSFRAPGGGLEGNRRLTATSDFDLGELSALGNSIMGGDGVFPNGPDILTVVANCVDSTGVSQNNPYTVTARVTWKESQA